MRWCWIALVIAGCGGGDAPAGRPATVQAVAPPTVAADPSPRAADKVYASIAKLDTITCPAGTTVERDPPPVGDYAYCVLPDGTRHGPWMTWPTRGNVRKIAIYDHGAVVHWTAWSASNDALEVDLEFRADVRHGRSLAWHDNGQLAADGEFVDGRPDGQHQAWDRDGRRIFVEVFGEAGGVLITWDGPDMVEQTWRDGALHGPTTTWYASGQVKSITVFVAGESRGDHEAWHENGQKAVEIRRGGASGADDQVTKWDEDGKVLPRMCAHGPCDAPPRQKYRGGP